MPKELSPDELGCILIHTAHTHIHHGNEAAAAAATRLTHALQELYDAIEHLPEPLQGMFGVTISLRIDGVSE